LLQRYSKAKEDIALCNKITESEIVIGCYANIAVKRWFRYLWKTKSTKRQRELFKMVGCNKKFA